MIQNQWGNKIMSNAAEKLNGHKEDRPMPRVISKEKPMTIKAFEQAEMRGHEQVAYFNFPHVGLKAIVGIHNTVLGPSLGGCRMRVYESEDQALDDALRLSEGMTYKSSLAGLNLGGGKAVLMIDPSKQIDREALFAQFAHCLNRLNGTYITAEDMGTCVDDIMMMRKITKYAAGFAKEEGGSGDPSPWTALGVFRAILAAVERKYGSKDLTGKRVTVQGAGHVGMYLLDHLTKAGAKCIVTDTSDAALASAKESFDIEVVGLDQIYDVDCDIYAPCAIGQTVNHDTIGRLKCDIIAGAANNILIDSSMHAEIDQRNMMYCPDFAINSGGVISVGAEYNPGGWNEGWVSEKVNAIYDTTHRILEESEKRGRFPEIVAVELAKERVAAAQDRAIQ